MKAIFRKGNLAAVLFALFVINIAASAQTQSAQPSEQEPAKQQQKQEAEKAEAQNIVIPPAPVIIKKNPNSISIPLDEAKPEPKFEERAATSTISPAATATAAPAAAAASPTAKIGSVYGYRRDPFTRRARFHSGVDIKARWGDPVGASQAGTVQFAGWYHGYGNLIIVDHGGGVTTYYAHLSSFEVEVGDKVERGVIVGYAGSTGRATSPHLHYEIRLNGNPVNPLQPLALDPSSEYFIKQSPTADEASRDRTAPPRKQDN